MIVVDWHTGLVSSAVTHPSQLNNGNDTLAIGAITHTFISQIY
jgi:hypothetical protein